MPSGEPALRLSFTRWLLPHCVKYISGHVGFSLAGSVGPATCQQEMLVSSSPSAPRRSDRIIRIMIVPAPHSPQNPFICRTLCTALALPNGKSIKAGITVTSAAATSSRAKMPWEGGDHSHHPAGARVDAEKTPGPESWGPGSPFCLLHDARCQVEVSSEFSGPLCPSSLLGPLSPWSPGSPREPSPPVISLPKLPAQGAQGVVPGPRSLARLSRAFRSEERRVGKECRSRWSPYH